MASLWMQERKDREAKKMAGYLSGKVAATLFSRMVNSFPGPKRMVGRFDALLYENDADFKAEKPMANVFVEFHSVPSAQERGQPKRKEEQKNG